MTRVLRGLAGLIIAAAAMTGLAGVVAGHAPFALTSSVALLVAITAWRPAIGLLLLAAFAPLGGALDALAPNRQGWTLFLLMGFTAGYALRLTWRAGRARDVWFEAAALAWTVIVSGSLLMVLTPDAGGVGPFASAWASRGFPVRADLPFAAIGVAAVAIAGAVIFVATSEECSAEQGLDRRVLATLLVSIAATGILNVYRLVEVALRRPPFPASILEVHRWLRISATFPDVNAAGAFFLLAIPPAILLLRQRAHRALGAATLLPALAGLWLSGSRTALIVFGLTLVAMALLAPGQPRRRRNGVTVAILGAALLLAAFYPRVETTGDSAISFGVRREMALATLRMLRDHPLGGLGVGRYRISSPAYMSPQMKSWYPSQNAHNQFLQVAGELGLPGLAVFVVLVGFGAVPAARAAWKDRDPLARGLAFGVLAFLAASLTMHPLLIPEVAVGFWIMLGLCRSTALRVPAA